jgi:hypothetical protein
MDVLLKFVHGLGDSTQLSCVAQHLRKHRPEWEIDVASGIGKHSVFHGLCRRSLILDRDPIDYAQYRWVFDVGWYECYSVYADSPCTKVCNTLRENFGIVPEFDLLKYRIEVGPVARRDTAAYLSAITDTPGNGKPFPAVAIHYQANTSAWKKDLRHELVAKLCEELLAHGYTPIILDWDRRSPLPDQRRIFCPAVGPGDLWGNTGTGDAERLAALMSQCALVIGVDSGPLHVAGATETRTLGVWSGHSPVQFYDLCPNVTHLVPSTWRTVPPCQNRIAAQFFEEHYAFRLYDDLERTLISTALETLERNGHDSAASVAPLRSGNGIPTSANHAPSSPFLKETFRKNPHHKETPMTATITNLNWELLPGLAQEIALGLDGSAWCLSIGESASGGHSIHRWNGLEWEHVPGGAVKIAVGTGGQPVIVDRQNQIFELTADGWRPLPGLAREIALGADGSAWCLSAFDFAPGGASIHVFNGHDWDHVDGAATKISVGPDGQPWIVNSAGQIFRRSGEGWELMPGLAREIACGADGSVWCLAAGEMPPGGASIHCWNGADWEHVPGAAAKIVAGFEGRVWIVNSEHNIFRGVSDSCC